MALAASAAASAALDKQRTEENSKDERQIAAALDASAKEADAQRKIKASIERLFGTGPKQASSSSSSSLSSSLSSSSSSSPQVPEDRKHVPLPPPAAVPAPAWDDDTCPLCMEDLDATDQTFRPCPCDFRVCLFCYDRMRGSAATAGETFSCPACRKAYGEPQYCKRAATTAGGNDNKGSKTAGGQGSSKQAGGAGQSRAPNVGSGKQHSNTVGGNGRR